MKEIFNQPTYPQIKMVDIISNKSNFLWQIENLEKDHVFQTKEAENSPDHEITMVRGEKSDPTQSNFGMIISIKNIKCHSFNKHRGFLQNKM